MSYEFKEPPQVIAVKEVKKTKQVEASQNFIQSITDIATTKKTQQIKVITKDKLPELPDVGDNLSWYLFPNSILDKLLGMAKSPTESMKITTDDVKYIVKCCDYKNLFKFAYNRTLAKKAIKILSYMAENKRRLTEDAIRALINEFDKNDLKTSNNVLLALCYAINNGQEIGLDLVKKIETKLKDLISEFNKKVLNDPDAFLLMPVIVVGLAAMAMLEKDLNLAELTLLENALLYIKGTNHPYFPKTDVDNALHSRNKIGTQFTIYRVLKKMKDIARDRKFLAKEEIDYSGKKWDMADEAIKSKVMQIVKYVSVNGQRNFLKDKTIVTAMEDGLAKENKNRKIKNNAIIAASYIIHSNDTQQGENVHASHLKDAVDKALSHQREYALRALNHHVAKHKYNKISNKKRLIDIIEQIEKKPEEEENIRGSATFLLSLMNDNVDMLAHLLLNESYCAKTVISLANAARQKLKMSDLILAHLGKIIADQCGFTVSFDVKYNAISIVGLVIENGQEIPKTLFDILINEAKTNHNKDILNIIIAVIDNEVSKNHISYLSNDVIIMLMKMLADKELSQNTACVLTIILQKIEKNIYEKEFDKIFDLAGSILNSKDYDYDSKKNASILLIHATKKGYHLNDQILNSFAKALSSSENEIRTNALQAIWVHTSNAINIVLSKEILNSLVQLLNDKDPVLRNNAVVILCLYIEKCHTKIEINTINSMIGLLSVAERASDVSNIFVSLARKQYQLDINCLEKISRLVNSTDIQVKRNVAFILNESIQICTDTFTPPIISNLMVILNHPEEDIQRSVLSCLSKASQRQFRNGKSLKIHSDAFLQLASMIENQHNETDNRIHSAHILKYQAEFGEIFNIHTLDILQRSIEEIELTKIILNIMRMHFKNIKCNFSNNKSMKLNEILNTICVLLNRDEILNDNLLLEEVVLTLKQANTSNYYLPISVLELITEIVISHKCDKIRDHALDLINNISYQLPEKTHLLKQLESNSAIIGNPIQNTSDNIYEAAEFICNTSINGQCLTVNNLKMLESQLVVDDEKLRGLIYRIILNETKNKNELPILPNGLIEKISKNINSSFLGKNKFITLALTQVILKGQYVDDCVIDHLQTEFVERTDLEIEFISVFEVAVTANKTIHQNTITKLEDLLTHTDVNIQKQSSKLLCLLLKNNPNVLISQDKLSLALKNDLDEEVRKNIFIVLENNSKCHKLSPYLELILNIKKQQDIIKNINSSDETLLGAIKYIFSKPEYLTKDVLESASILLENKHSNIQKTILSHLTNHLGNIQLPDSLLRISIQLLLGNEDNSCHTEAQLFIKMAIQLKTLFPANVIDSVFDTMLWNKSTLLRNLAFKLLSSMKEYHDFNAGQVKIISIEAFGQSTPAATKNLKFQSELSLTEMINENLPLSLSNFIKLYELLDTKNEKVINQTIEIISKYIINVRYASMYEDVLYKLISLIGIKSIDISKIDSICFKIIESGSFKPTNVDNLIQLLITQILSNGVNYLRTDLLEDLIRLRPSTLYDHLPKLIDVLVKALFSPFDEKTHDSVISLISVLIKQYKNLPDSVLQSLSKIVILSKSCLNIKNDNEVNNLGMISGAYSSLNKGIDKFLTYVGYRYSEQKYSLFAQEQIFKLLNYIQRVDSSFIKNSKEIISWAIEYLSNIYNIGQQGMQIIENIKDPEKQIYILLSLISRDKYYFDLDILEETIVAETLSKEMLCNELLSLAEENSEDDDEYQEDEEIFWDYLASLEHQMGYDDYNIERDYILEYLTDKIRRENLKLYDINQLLIILKHNHKGPLEILEKSFVDIKSDWLLHSLENIVKSKNLEHTLIKEIESLYRELDWDVEYIGKFFTKLKNVKSINEIYEFLLFLKKHKIADNLYDRILNGPIQNNDVNALTSWKLLIIENLVKKKIQSISSLISREIESKSKQLIYKQQILNDRINRLIQLGWSFEKLFKLLEELELIVNDEGLDGFERIFDAVNIAYCYGLTEQEFYSTNINNSAHFDTHHLHQLAVFKHVKNNAKNRDPSSILDEFKSINVDKYKYNLTFDNTKFLELLSDIKELYENKKELPSGCPKLSGPINTWGEADIKFWANYIKEHRDKLHYKEVFAVLMRACYLHTKEYEPRITQLLSLYTLLNTQDKKGRLAQILTGEGKSCIDVMHAIIRVLQGRKVDIITINSILAKREVEEYRYFYDLFNIQIDCNEDDKYTSGTKKCYRKEVDVVYGDINNFQYDMLNDLRLKTRAGRDYDFVIVDEADNLLIDEGAKIAMLSTTIPGMDYLEPLLLIIWQELQRIGTFVFKSGDQWFYRDEPEFDDGKPTQREIQNLEQFICPKLDCFIKKALEEKNGKRNFNIPKHLEKFVEKQIPKWIHSAYLAYFIYTPKHHYEIKLNKRREKIISPVDYANTGVIQNGTTWGDGLHQFLQIKHGLNLTSENLITNFISNMEYIKKYKNISGVTGTLGSEKAKELLSDPKMYPIDFAYIPTFKAKQFYEMKGIVADSDDIWLHEIISSVIREAQNGRVALVICETIEQADDLYDAIRKCFSGNLKKYTDSDANTNHFINDALEGNSIVVATNLAGRGTDVKLSPSVVQAGGLHTCVTFLPSNKRVEDQAFGRGSRKGEPGTGQLILNKRDLVKKLKDVLPDGQLKSDDMEYIKKLRDEHEKLHLDHVKNSDLPLTKKKDELFVKYRDLVKQFDAIDTKIKSCVDKEHKRSAVEERWGLWLKEHKIADDSIFDQFETFKENILKEYENDSVIKNPCYFISQGNDLLTRANSWREKIKNRDLFGLYDRAISAFDEAINLDREHAYLAYYNRACAILKNCEGGDKEYKEKAKADLFKCINIISEKILPQLDYILQIMNQSNLYTKEVVEQVLSQQIYAKIQILRLLINSAQQAISRIERSQKLIDITYEQHSGITTHTKLRKDHALYQLSTNPQETVSLSFHDLNTSTDAFWTKYQSLNTLSKVNGSNINIIYDSKNIRGGEDVKKLFKNLLPIKRQAEVVTKIQQEAPKEVQELIALDEKFYAFTNATADKIMSIFKAVTKVATTVASPLSKGLDKLSELWNNFQIAKELPVNISLESLKIEQAKTFISKLVGHQTNLNMIISHISKDDFEIIQSTLNGRKLDVNSCEIVDATNGKVIINKKPNNDNKISEHGHYEIILRDISVAEANKLLPLLDKKPSAELPFNPLSFKFELNNLSQANADKIIDCAEGELSLSFNNLDKRKADSIVYFTQSYNNDAIYQITNLKKQDAENLIIKADRKEEDLSVTLKTLESEFMKTSDLSNEVNVFNNDGLLYLFDVKELNPMPWISIAFVTLLGVSQIAAGFALATLTMGFGANFGISLMAEGISDLIKAASIAYTREFSLSSFITQKTFSIAMSLATAGWSTFQMSKEAARAAKVAATGLDLVDDIAVNTGGLLANMIGTNAAKTSAKVAGRQLLASAIETGASEFTSNVLEKVSQYTIDKIRPKIIADINKSLKIQFENGTWNRILTKIFAIDKFLRNNAERLNAYQEMVYKAIDKIINDSKFEFMGFKGIKLSPANQFIEEFTKVLRDIEEKHLPSIAELLYEDLKLRIKLEREDFDKIYKLLLEQKIISHNGKIIRQALNTKKIDLKEYNNFHDEIVESCEALVDIFDDDYYVEHSRLCQTMTELITEQVCDTIESAALPAKKGIGFGVSYGVGKFTNKYIKNAGVNAGDASNSTEDDVGKETANKNTSKENEPSAAGQVESSNLNERTNVNTNLPTSPDVVDGSSVKNPPITREGGDYDSIVNGSNDSNSGKEVARPSGEKMLESNAGSSNVNKQINGADGSDASIATKKNSQGGMERASNQNEIQPDTNNNSASGNKAPKKAELSDSKQSSSGETKSKKDGQNHKKNRKLEVEKGSSNGNKAATNAEGSDNKSSTSNETKSKKGSRHHRKDRNLERENGSSKGSKATNNAGGSDNNQPLNNEAKSGKDHGRYRRERDRAVKNDTSGGNSAANGAENRSGNQPTTNDKQNTGGHRNRQGGRDRELRNDMSGGNSATKGAENGNSNKQTSNDAKNVGEHRHHRGDRNRDIANDALDRNKSTNAGENKNNSQPTSDDTKNPGGHRRHRGDRTRDMTNDALDRNKSTNATENTNNGQPTSDDRKNTGGHRRHRGDRARDMTNDALDRNKSTNAAENKNGNQPTANDTKNAGDRRPQNGDSNRDIKNNAADGNKATNAAENKNGNQPTANDTKNARDRRPQTGDNNRDIKNNAADGNKATNAAENKNSNQPTNNDTKNAGDQRVQNGDNNRDITNNSSDGNKRVGNSEGSDNKLSASDESKGGIKRSDKNSELNKGSSNGNKETNISDGSDGKQTLNNDANAGKERGSSRQENSQDLINNDNSSSSNLNDSDIDLHEPSNFNSSVNVDSNALLNCTVGALKDIVLDRYRKHLIDANQQWRKQCVNKIMIYNEQQRQMCNEIKKQYKLSIKNLIRFILIVLKENEFRNLNHFQKGTTNHLSLNNAVILKEADLILANCMRGENAQAQYRIVIKHLEKISSDDKPIKFHLSNLGQLFSLFNDVTSTEEKLMLENISKFWIDKSKMPSILVSFNTQNYAEQANILNDGKLGASGYIISNVIDGMIKCHLESEQIKRAAQTAVTGIIKDCLVSEQGLLAHIQAIQQVDHYLIAILKDNLFTQISPLVKAQSELIKNHDAFLLELKNEEDGVKKEVQVLDEESNKICASNMSEAKILQQLDRIEKKLKTLQDRIDNKRKERHEFMLQFTNKLQAEIEQSHLTKREFILDLEKQSKRHHEFAKYFAQVHETIVLGCQSIMDDILKQNITVIDKLGDIVGEMAEQVTNKKQGIENKNGVNNNSNEAEKTETQRVAFIQRSSAADVHRQATESLLASLNNEKNLAPSRVDKNNAFFIPTKENTSANNKLPVTEGVEPRATSATNNQQRLFEPK